MNKEQGLLRAYSGAGIYHDSIVRSEWLPIGLSRRAATKLADKVSAELIALGIPKHHGGGSYGSADSIAPTSPGGWKASHPRGASTVKVRGCETFRRYAIRYLKAELASDGQEV